MSDIQTVKIRLRALMVLFAISMTGFSMPLAADQVVHCHTNISDNDTYCTNECGDTNFKELEDTKWIDTSSVNSVYRDASSCITDSGPLRGRACICVDEDQDCLAYWGKMSFLGWAYGTTFTKVGVVEGGCGEDTPTINGRRAGYLRLKSNPGNCIQSTADPANGGATHFWGNCATGDNQRRRVISYDTQNHQLQFASDTSLCLVVPTFPDGFPAPPIAPIVIQDCATASSEQRDWELSGDSIRLLADTSKCMVTTDTSQGGAIVLEDCSVGERARWQLTWTQDH